MDHRDKRHRIKSVQYSDPGKIMDLVMNLTDDNCALLQTRINVYDLSQLKEECNAELVFLIVVHTDRKEASIEAAGASPLQRKVKIHLTPRLLDVLKAPNEQMDYFSNFGSDVKGVVSHFLTKDVNRKIRVMMLPLSDKPFSLIICIVSPNCMEDQVASMVQECLLYTWPTMKKAIALEFECTMKQKCQQLLRVTKRLFTKVASMETLLQIAMDQAKALTKASHCSVMLVDIEKMELVESYFENKDAKVMVERRFPMNIGVTGQVIRTGVLVNAHDAQEHPAYDPNIDCRPGVECRSLLCFPIRDNTGIIGVGQLMNKIADPYFDAMDEELALAFSIYCGVCIMHSIVYERIQEAHIRNALANELVMYYMKVNDSEVVRLLECKGYHDHPHATSIHFNPKVLPLRELPCYALKMFTDLGFDQRFNIRHRKLARYILHVKKSYRDVPYHSWMHGFSVGQWAYAALYNFKLIQNGYLSDLQGLMYLVAAFMHDIDHRGTTNSFQIQGQTMLAALYSSEGSVLERHHLAQAICVLNTEGCDILESLPRKDYDRALVMLRDYILSTDLSTYFKNLNDYKTISMDYQKGNRVHTSALQSMLMNAADLGDQLKDWSGVKKTAAAVLTEFFRQGDEEKNRGDLPSIIMDREKCFIPDLEIQFLGNVCMPLYTMLGRIIPKAAPCTTILEAHIEKWDAAKPIFAEVPPTAGLAVLLSPELDTLIEQNIKERERQRALAEEEAAT